MNLFNWLKPQKKELFNQFAVVRTNDPQIVYDVTGVLFGGLEQVSGKSYKRHRFTIISIRNSKDIYSKFPISEQISANLFNAERRTEKKILFQRFFGLNAVVNQFNQTTILTVNQINLTHTLYFGYWLETGTYLEILNFSFNAKIKDDKRHPDLIAAMIGDFIVTWLLDYKARYDKQGNFIQHEHLTSVTVKNKILWLCRIFSEYCWYANKRV